jgi:hypothetical protein
MSEIKPADRIVLDVLRQTTLAKMSDADFANLEAEVASKGLRNVDGWLGTQMRKAVEQVLKHPGHGDQSVHGGGRGKGGKAPASGASAGGSTAGDEQVARAQEILANAKEGAKYTSASDIKKEQEMMRTATKSDAIGRAHKHDQDYRTAIADSNAYAKRATEIRAAQSKDPKAERIAEAYDSDSRRFQTEAAISMKLASAWSSVAMDLGASESDLVVKAVEPVTKHPGHGDQSVHGGGRRGGGASGSANKPPQGTAVFDNEQNMSQTELQASRTASMKTGVEGSAHKGKWEVSNTGSAEIYFGSGNPVNKLGESHFAIVGVQKVKLGGGANPKPYTVEVTKLSRKNGGLSGGTRKRAEFASVEEAFAAVDKLIGQQPSFSSSEVLGR